MSKKQKKAAAGAAPERAENRGGRVALFAVLGVALFLGGLYAAAYLMAGDKVPRGTTVAGVSIGGEPQSEAAASLEQGLADRAAQPIQITVDGGERVRELDPASVGLEVDYEASVAEAGGRRSWSPERLWTYFTGGDELEPVIDVDEARVERYLDALEQAEGEEPVEGAISMGTGRVAVREPATGLGLDRDAALDALREGLVSEERRVDLDLVEVDPEIDADDVAAAREAFADQAVSGPVELRLEDSAVRLSPAAFGRVLTAEPVDGALELQIDSARLKTLVDNRVSEPDSPVDATVRLVDGEPQVVPGEDGVSYSEPAILEAFEPAVLGSGDDRRAQVESEVAEPEFTTEDAQALEIKEVVSEFTTYYPHADYRNINIGRAAEIIDGYLLKPGETFSMNDTVGERTAANGFTEGYIISNGILRRDLGGGVSQMATTLFNGMFFAGLEDIEHKPHSFYIDRYPVGREATVAWGSVDLRFRNDTDYGVLIDTQLNPSTPGSQGSITVRMWSTKVWDIDEITGNRYNFTSPATRTLTTPDCEPHTGYGGFDIDVTRIFKNPGSSEEVRREVFKTTYTPSDSVVCQPPASSSGGSGSGSGSGGGSSDGADRG